MELGVPWRAAEYIHWQLGEVEMARRAGVVPFSMAATAGSSSQPLVAMLPVGAGGMSNLSEDPRSGLGYLGSGTTSSSQSPVAMMRAGVSGTPYPSEDLRNGSGYFAEGVLGRSSFDSGENLGRTIRRHGTVSPVGAGGNVGGAGSSGRAGNNFLHGAVLPSMAELDRGIIAFDSGTTPESSPGQRVPAGRGTFNSEQRGRGRP
ncbi:hypothetical protein MMC34_006583 [Xylographa carneopallida]|nr:hypothetical protein [Xylographa carneopallida]